MGRHDAVRDRCDYKDIRRPIVDMDRHLRGTGLREKEIKEGKVLYTEWKPAAKYAWDAGVAMSRFLDELKNGRIFGTACHR